MTSILVVDDHAVVASGTKVVLENAGFEVKALPDVRDLKAEVGARHYDLYLVDLNMPGMDGIEAADTIFQADPDAKVVIYTGYESEIEPLFSTMVTRGIAGIVSKSASVESLIAAVRAALRDEVLLPMWLFRKLDICGQSAVDSSENLHFNHLEKEIMAGVIHGATNKQIAEHLHVGQRTVEKYLTGVFRKLGVHSRAEAADQIARSKLLTGFHELPAAGERKH